MSELSSSSSAKAFPNEFVEEPQFHRSMNIYDDGKQWNVEVMPNQQRKYPQNGIGNCFY
jgi:hypothetical protein